MEINDGKRLILMALCELAWANGRIEQSEADFIAGQAEQMDLALGGWLPDLIMALSTPPLTKITNLRDVPIDEVERYQVVERFLALCLLDGGLDENQAQVLAGLALQLDIRAQELEEMRRRIC